MLIIDTDILIDAVRNITAAVDYLEQAETATGLAIKFIKGLMLQSYP